jgi:hypothetical protein
VRSIPLVVAAVIHLLPVAGLLGRDALRRLYGRSFEDPDLEIMMRHRAVLFGLLGALLLYAAAEPRVRGLAYGAGLVSAVSFLVLALSVGGYGEAMRRVVVADVVAVVALIAGAIAERTA